VKIFGTCRFQAMFAMQLAAPHVKLLYPGEAFAQFNVLGVGDMDVRTFQTPGDARPDYDCKCVRLPAALVCESLTSWDYNVLDPVKTDEWLHSELHELNRYGRFDNLSFVPSSAYQNGHMGTQVYLRAQRFVDAFRACIDTSFVGDYHRKFAFLTPPVRRLLITEEEINCFTHRHPSMHALVWELRPFTCFHYRHRLSKAIRYRRFTDKSVAHYEALAHVMRCALMHELEKAPRFKAIKTVLAMKDSDVDILHGERHGGHECEAGYTTNGIWTEIVTSPIPEVLVRKQV